MSSLIARQLPIAGLKMGFARLPLAALILIGLPKPVLGQGEALVLRDVNVIPMDSERVMPRQSIVIRAGSIVELGSFDDVRVPAGSIVIDGAGRFVIPGLVDSHVHVEASTSCPSTSRTESLPW